MKVKNCLGDTFQYDCQQLMKQIQTMYQPDVVVAIRSGGLVVAQQMLKTQGGAEPLLIDVLAQRPNTKHKNSIKLDKILAYLPSWLCDFLRIMEMQYAIKRFNRHDFSKRDVIIEERYQTDIKMAQRILVIDDAVDSGITLMSVLELIKQLSPHAEIKSAALTVTFPAPLVEPDFLLYRHVLLRFPWAADAKGRT